MCTHAHHHTHSHKTLCVHHMQKVYTVQNMCNVLHTHTHQTFMAVLCTPPSERGNNKRPIDASCSAASQLTRQDRISCRH